MRRASSLLVLAVLVVAVAAPASAAQIPPNSRFRGADAVAWQRAFIRWVAGSDESPIFTESCGEIFDGVYFAPVSSNTGLERTCQVPVGLPIVASPVGVFSEIPTFGSNDEEIIADARATFEDAVISSEATFDGRALRLVTVEAGAYDLTVEEGSFYDLIEDGTPNDWSPGDTVRLATVAQVVLITPPRPGEHTLFLSTEFLGAGGTFDITLTLDVG